MVSSSVTTSSQPHRIAATLLWTSSQDVAAGPEAPQRRAGCLEGGPQLGDTANGFRLLIRLITSARVGSFLHTSTLSAFPSPSPLSRLPSLSLVYAHLPSAT